jgi:hypothetical protein
MNEQAGSTEFESRLIPIMREAIEIIKMILFTEVRDSLAQRLGAQSASVGRLSGAVVNELFGTPNPQAEFVAFAEENREIIAAELFRLASAQEKLRIPLTDALRVQFLCDAMEGADSQQVLVRARELGILIAERELPLPNNFLFLVRRLGAARGLIQDTAGD